MKACSARLAAAQGLFQRHGRARPDRRHRRRGRLGRAGAIRRKHARRPVRAGAAQHRRDPRLRRRRAREHRAHDLLRHLDRGISRQPEGDRRGVEARSWARIIRRWRWSRSSGWSSRDAKVEIESDGGGARMRRSGSSRTACRRRTSCREFRFDLPELISRAPQRRRRTAQGRRAGRAGRSSTTMAAGPMPSSTISRAASRGCWSRRKASSPAIACCCAGPTATPCSPPGSACSRPAGWWWRPCRCSARARSRP